METLPILIIGAGPTGLTMAYLLSLYGIPFRIIDKKIHPTQTSNALALQSRSLEMLDDLGIANDFVEVGQKVNAVTINEKKDTLLQLTTHYLKSAFPFILIVPQSITEEILSNHLFQLGKKVERGCEILQLKTMDGVATAEIQNTLGTTETIHANWIIACDGAHSRVREALGIKFEGNDITEQFILADVTAKSTYPNDQIQIFIAKEGLAALFPLPDNRIRIVANILTQNISHYKDPCIAELQDIVRQRMQNPIEIQSSNWMSKFWIHQKVVEHMQIGNIFLLGDSAHIHSPAGGQGMNTGMQDAYNLAWKLAMVIQKKATPELIDSFAKEREPIAHSVLKDTGRMTRMMISKNIFVDSFRRASLKIANRINKLQSRFINRISQLSLSYRHSNIISYEHHYSRKSPKPGNRAPDVDYIDANGLPQRFNESLRGGNFHLVVFSGKTVKQKKLDSMRALLAFVEKHYPDTIEPVVVSTNNTRELLMGLTKHNYVDQNHGIHTRYRIDKPGVYLIRPDKYIAYCSKRLSITDIERIMEKNLGGMSKAA